MNYAPKIALFLIGDELLNGKLVDRNIPQLTIFLRSHGLFLDEAHIMPDNLDQLATVMSESLKKADVTIISGGLGPTKDDITKDALAKCLGTELTYSQECFDLVNHHYQRAGRDYSDYQHGYENLPENVSALLNPVGMAPGLLTKQNGHYLVCVPGVPGEFSSMLEESFFRSIFFETKDFKSRLPKEVITVRTMKTPEAKIFSKLAPSLWDELSEFGKIASLPQVMGVDITVTIEGDQETRERTKASVISHLKNSPIGPIIWSFQNETIESALIRVLKKRDWTLACAESCTGGLIADSITNVPGCSSVFLGGVVSYANELKEGLLGVESSLIKKHGAVSTEVALAMAHGVRERTGASFAVATSGIAGPGGGSPEKPVGTLCHAVVGPDIEFADKTIYRGDRALLKERFKQAALFSLWEKVTEL